MSSKSTNSIASLNFASNTRASLEIHAAPGISYNCTSFSIPSISTTAPKQPTPFTDFPLRGDTLLYAPLEISFIVTENLENWRLAVAWMEGFTAPVSAQQWLDKKFEYSDATVFLYNSHNNLKIQVEFSMLTPTYIGGLRFATTPEGVIEIMCDMTFEYQYYEVKDIEKITKKGLKL